MSEMGDIERNNLRGWKKKEERENTRRDDLTKNHTTSSFVNLPTVEDYQALVQRASQVEELVVNLREEVRAGHQSLKDIHSNGMTNLQDQVRDLRELYDHSKKAFTDLERDYKILQERVEALEPLFKMVEPKELS